MRTFLDLNQESKRACLRSNSPSVYTDSPPHPPLLATRNPLDDMYPFLVINSRFLMVFPATRNTLSQYKMPHPHENYIKTFHLHRKLNPLAFLGSGSVFEWGKERWAKGAQALLLL